MAQTPDPRRFLLFAGYTYYPEPAWGDFRGAYETMQEMKEVLHQLALYEGVSAEYNWYQIVDRQTLTLVEEGKLSEQ